MKLKKNYKDYKKIISERNISELIHFTPTKNLYGIMEMGEIMSRARLEELDVEHFDILDYIEFNDEIRYDDKNYINLSISSPNTFLFSKFRDKTKDDPTIVWCVLKIETKYIYEYDTLFSVTNAASNAAKKQFGISGNIEMFKQLFANELIFKTYRGNRKIKRGKIKDKYPTDVQAEILVKSSIPISSIKKVCFLNNEELAMTKAALDNFNTDNFIVEPEIFNPNRNL
jgi:hypothetical protein